MFATYCPRHQARALLGPRSITALVNTPDGIVLHWCCSCGARGTHATGRRSSVVDSQARPAAIAA